MGRPLNKKYFGNRNVGTGGDQTNGILSNSQNYSDDRIGGEGIASINWSNYGSWLSTAGGANAPLAGLQLPAPSLPGGVQATWTNYFGAAAVTTGAGKTGLISGETYEYAPIPGLIVTVGSLSGANALFTVTAPGSTTTLLTDLQTVSLTLRTGQGHTGVSTFTVDIKLKIVDTVIGEKGSGYTGTETFTVTTANGATGTAPAGTIVLTTDSGVPYASGNQENAIILYANTSGGGSTGKIADIIKQTNARSYKVKTADGIGVIQLSTDATPATGYGYMVATDSGGATYYVTKLTAHRATLINKTGSPLFSDEASVPWKLSTSDAGYSSSTTVIIQNA